MNPYLRVVAGHAQRGRRGLGEAALRRDADLSGLALDLRFTRSSHFSFMVGAENQPGIRPFVVVGWDATMMGAGRMGFHLPFEGGERLFRRPARTSRRGHVPTAGVQFGAEIRS
ncbi:MAG: hypothetical protein ACRDH5_17305 [bacterium]